MITGFTHCRCKSTDQIDMLPVAQPVSTQDRAGREGRGRYDINALDRIGQRGDGFGLPSVCIQFGRKLVCGFGEHIPGFYRLNRPHGSESFGKLRGNLARTYQQRVSRVFASQITGRQCRSCGRAPRGQNCAVQKRKMLAGPRVELQHRSRNRGMTSYGSWALPSRPSRNRWSWSMRASAKALHRVRSASAIAAASRTLIA